MLVPFGAIPEHLLKPLHVDTALQYNLKKLKIPNLKDPSYCQSTLLLAPFQHQLEFISDSPEYSFDERVFKPFGKGLKETGSENNSVWAESQSMLNRHKEDIFSDSLTSYRMFSADNEPVQNTTSVQDGRSSKATCSPDYQTDTCMTADLTVASEKLLLNLNDVFLGAPLQYGRSVMQIKDPELEKSSVFHSTSDTNIPMFPMKEEDIDWFFTNPVTSHMSDSTSDDVITYTNLTKMGYIWETDYSLDCENQDNCIESRV